ncbi:MAG TPA: D-alanyl-D-alanine carboxypeptidase, partial [Candidatus Limnocylindria bacterium]|nr:D-alanyl-D-alanine carboxypeptidase [Candidatus Limnocylindria bacterium]
GVGGPTGAADPVQLARYPGHRLDAIIQAMLSVSDDEIAETLFRHVALATGRPASMAGGRAAQRAVLRSLGVPLEGVITSSGSGRSSIDRFSARALVRMLAVAVDGKHPRMAALRDGTAFTGGLPLMMRAGIDGTLRTAYGRYSTRPSSCARGKVYAKTGGLTDAIALSGYAKGSDGRWKVFSVLVNSRPKGYSPLATRQHVDRIAASVTGCY